MGRHHSKQATSPPPTRDSTSTTKGAKQQIRVTGTAEAHTQLDLYTACTTVMRQTIALKIVPSTLSKKRRWMKT
jgi:hypothetical protein